MQLLSRRARGALIAATLASPCAAPAVSVDPGGRGQALIYPYYTVQSAGGNAFNTYLSVVNHDRDSDKALRVRFRESRNGREVAALNLFLGRNDVWTAALVPDGQGTRLVTRDASCTEPLLWQGQFPGVTQDGLAFSNALFAGPNADGAGEGLDRTREGYIEILEMATLNNVAPHALALAITHTAAGAPNNCGAVQAGHLASATPAGTFTPPTGGLSGTFTLINVANGMDASLAAEALSQVATLPYFRPSTDSYPSFAAAEVDPVSHVVQGNVAFRSTWLRGVDAVSAALMRHEVAAEWTVESATASQTDYVFTFPTRHHYVAGNASPPFSSPGWSADCGASGPAAGFVGEPFTVEFFDRSQRGATLSYQPAAGAMPATVLCAAAAVAPVTNGSGTVPPPSLLGSQSIGTTYRQLGVHALLDRGFIRFSFGGNARPGAARLVSEAGSTRTDIATGQTTSGRHTFTGMPVTGFAVRTLRNGILSCAGGTCQGNYASALPFAYVRSISSP